MEEPSIICLSEDESFIVLGSVRDRPNLQSQSNPSSCSQLEQNTRENGDKQSLSSQASQKEPSTMATSTFTTMNISPSFLSSSGELNSDEIQAKINNVIWENKQLKEKLSENNIAMKQQFVELVKWQEELMNVHANHKAKFDETKLLINNLRTENVSLKKTIIDQVALKKENEELKEKLKKIGENKRQESPEASLDTVAKQLALVERFRSEEMANNEREQNNLREEIKKLREQLFAAQIKITDYEAQRESSLGLGNRIEKVQMQNDTDPKSLTDINLYNSHVENLNQFLESHQQKCRTLQNYFEALVSATKNSSSIPVHIITLITQLNDIATSFTNFALIVEAQNDFKKIFNDYKILNEQLEQTRRELDNSIIDVKTSNSTVVTLRKEISDYKLKLSKSVPEEEIFKQMNDLNKKIQILTNEISTKDDRIKVIQEEVRSMKTLVDHLRLENEEISILKAQVDVYRTDFDLEKEARLSLLSEKDRVVEDLRLLQRRNEELIKQIEDIDRKGKSTGAIPRTSSSSAENVQSFSNSQTKNKSESPPPYHYQCPVCNKKFRSLRFLEDHVDQCLPHD